MPAVTIKLLERHPGQAEIVDNRKRFNVVCCGRRFGKDVLGIDLLVEKVIEGRPVGWFSPSYKNLTEAWRAMTDILGPVTVRRSEQEHRIEVKGGGVVEMWSLDIGPDTSPLVQDIG